MLTKAQVDAIKHVRKHAIARKDKAVETIDHILAVSQEAFVSRFARPYKRSFDHYIEAQVHGRVSLANDVEFLVADPSFRGTETGQHLSEACRKFGVTLHWHGGYVLSTAEVPTDFRGPTMPSMAKRVAPDGILDVKTIGDASASLKRNPHAWSDWGSETDVLQELKLLWHVLLRFGQPAVGDLGPTERTGKLEPRDSLQLAHRGCARVWHEKARHKGAVEGGLWFCQTGWPRETSY